MNRTEYLATLERTLSQTLDPDEIRDIITYYENYMNTEMAKGKSEQEVLESLGQPRLLAKSILAAHVSRDTSSVLEMKTDERAPFWGRKWKGLLSLLLVLFVVFCVIGLVFSIIGVVLPFLLVAAGIWFLYQFMQKKR